MILLVMSLFSFNRPDPIRTEATIEKIYGNDINCVGNKYYTGVTEKKSFYNELQNLIIIEDKKDVVLENCIKNLPSLVSVDFRKHIITQADHGDSLVSAAGLKRITNMSWFTFLTHIECISSSLNMMNLVHCDMQPKNFVIDFNRVISIIDFDMAYSTMNKITYPQKNHFCTSNVTKSFTSNSFKTKWNNVFRYLN